MQKVYHMNPLHIMSASREALDLIFKESPMCPRVSLEYHCEALDLSLDPKGDYIFYIDAMLYSMVNTSFLWFLSNTAF